MSPPFETIPRYSCPMGRLMPQIMIVSHVRWTMRGLGETPKLPRGFRGAGIVKISAGSI
ncbi:hypothetical protein AGR3A_Cc20220 [Agrobacterium tomkonis CFBP 6623]|uniref:Uncharacterized protein n=1 Tax=Agrobacterium tomkonis CFBP 6623 TaxID=1183432 RepID=A0A1S7P8B3_9HYPH|nr:hypothetical protein AGR3A_Cc20220 [Agrobacterium tomkonis CFBP 6623]